MLTIARGASVTIMENVVNLLDKDKMHGLVTQMNSYLLLHGLIAVGIWRLMCSDLGGTTGRERVFLRWELLDMASSLPAVSDGPRSNQRSSVLEFCQPLSEVGHLSVRGQSGITLLKPVHCTVIVLRK